MIANDGLVEFDPDHTTYLLTASGWARSGKGTSMANLKDSLEESKLSVELIDQGIKFRAMGYVAIVAGQELDSPTALNDFISTPTARAAAIAILGEVADMDAAEKKALLYTPDISSASGKVGKVPSAHEVAVGLLRTQVETAAENGTDVILVDGRSIEKYAYQFSREGLARYVMGWYFKCDPAVAARRSLGLFDDLEDLASADKTRLLEEILNISDRNRNDTLRDVDPLLEPWNAYHLDLARYALPDSTVPYKRAHDILHTRSTVVVDTSYTNSVGEMTGPVTELSRFGLFLKGLLSHQDVGISEVRYQS